MRSVTTTVVTTMRRMKAERMQCIPLRETPDVMLIVSVTD